MPTTLEHAAIATGWFPVTIATSAGLLGGLAVNAHSEAAVRRRRERPMKIMENTALFEFFLAKLKLRWSP